MMVEELDARTAPTGAAASSSANRCRLKSSRSGPFSCTNCASATAAPADPHTVNRSSEAPSASPSPCITGQIRASSKRNSASASGAGS
jgi:hypothetical protein